MRYELDNPMIRQQKPRKVEKQERTVEETCSCCGDTPAKVKINGQRYCWDCAEIEGVERIA